MASNVGICNRALQKLGATRIVSLTEDSRNARACNAAFEAVRDALLRKHPWNFAITRVTLAPDATDPDFEYDYAFSLPSDCLRILPDNEVTDWVVEGRKILTNDGDTLELRYIKRVTDPNEFDPYFTEVLSAAIAVETCEEITQSNTKFQLVESQFKDALREAKQVNAFETISSDPPEDTWLTVRA